jgi:hypothetical protein
MHFYRKVFFICYYVTYMDLEKRYSVTQILFALVGSASVHECNYKDLCFSRIGPCTYSTLTFIRLFSTALIIPVFSLFFIIWTLFVRTFCAFI